MATAYYCDLCGAQTKPEDLRYIDFWKTYPHMGEDTERCHPQVECCTACMEEVKRLIREVR